MADESRNMLQSNQPLRVSIMVRRGRNKCHFIGIDSQKAKTLNPGDVISGMTLCAPHQWSEEWVVVNRRELRDNNADGGESQVCHACD